jgi:hypothetical protein
VLPVTEQVARRRRRQRDKPQAQWRTLETYINNRFHPDRFRACDAFRWRGLRFVRVALHLNYSVALVLELTAIRASKSWNRLKGNT